MRFTNILILFSINFFFSFSLIFAQGIETEIDFDNSGDENIRQDLTLEVVVFDDPRDALFYYDTTFCVFNSDTIQFTVKNQSNLTLSNFSFLEPLHMDKDIDFFLPTEFNLISTELFDENDNSLGTTFSNLLPSHSIAYTIVFDNFEDALSPKSSWIIFNTLYDTPTEIGRESNKAFVFTNDCCGYTNKQTSPNYLSSNRNYAKSLLLTNINSEQDFSSNQIILSSGNFIKVTESYFGADKSIHLFSGCVEYSQINLKRSSTLPANNVQFLKNQFKIFISSSIVKKFQSYQIINNFGHALLSEEISSPSNKLVLDLINLNSKNELLHLIIRDSKNKSHSYSFIL